MLWPSVSGNSRFRPMSCTFGCSPKNFTPRIARSAVFQHRIGNQTKNAAICFQRRFILHISHHNLIRLESQQPMPLPLAGGFRRVEFARLGCLSGKGSGASSVLQKPALGNQWVTIFFLKRPSKASNGVVALWDTRLQDKVPQLHPKKHRGLSAPMSFYWFCPEMIFRLQPISQHGCREQHGADARRCSWQPRHRPRRYRRSSRPRSR